MGSATTQARETITAALTSAGSIDLAIADELFAAARAVSGSSQLSGALSDSAAAPAARRQVATSVFGPLVQPATASLLAVVAEQRWSNTADLVDGIEELAIRAAAAAEPSADIEAELFAFSRTVASTGELELALGSRRGDAAAKGTLVSSLLGGRASAAATLIAASLARDPRERRYRVALDRAMDIVAAERGRTVATVYTATPLTAPQIERLRVALSARYETEIAINTVSDPSVVGGLRVQVADDVIDASVSARLADLRHRLAG